MTAKPIFYEQLGPFGASVYRGMSPDVIDFTASTRDIERDATAMIQELERRLEATIKERDAIRVCFAEADADNLKASSEIEALAKPVPFKGAQGIFTVPTSILIP